MLYNKFEMQSVALHTHLYYFLEIWANTYTYIPISVYANHRHKGSICVDGVDKTLYTNGIIHKLNSCMFG